MSVPRSVLARVTQRLLTRIPSTLAGLCLLPWECMVQANPPMSVFQERRVRSNG